jgi:hypothetical protein
MRSRRQPVHDRLGSTAARIAASPKSMPTAKEFPMRDRTIDALSVSAADALSHRRSLIALGGVALARQVPAGRVSVSSRQPPPAASRCGARVTTGATRSVRTKPTACSVVVGRGV